jgi:hypothetical protein
MAVPSRRFMSRMERCERPCLACGTPVEMYVWHVIDAIEYPDLKRQLLNGDVNVLPCPTCTRLCAFEIPLLYRDATLGFSVQYVPERFRTTPHFLRMYLANGTPRSPPRLTQTAPAAQATTSHHLVFALDEMIRYVTFRDRIWLRSRSTFL